MKENKNFKRLVIALVAAIMVISAVPLMISAENIATLSNNENGKAPWANGNSKADTFYAYNAYDSSMDEGPISFPSDDPNDITLLYSYPGFFITGGCFVEDVWYACEYYDGTTYPDDLIWTIDTTDGSMTEIGNYDLTEALNGLAYDDSTETLYGCSGTNLYTIDTVTGSASLVGSMGTAGLFVGIASDGAGTLYGIDLGDESLYSINPTTAVATLIGSTGLTLNYAQDMAYDKNNDILYLAAYEDPGDGSLQICDVTDGSTTLVGAFGVLEVTAFGIPYSLFTPEHDISVTDIVVPDTVPHGETQTVSAMVNNIGNNTETGVIVDFKVGGSVIDSTTISSLLSEESTPVSFNWDPAIGNYFVEIESQPITDEYDLLNNVVNKTVDVIAAPAIDVTPTSLDFMVPTDDSDTEILTIINLASAEAVLDYDITVDDGGAGWLSALPVSGTIAIDDYDDITITVDTTGMTQGDYTGSVIITSNDLNDPEVIVPVDLTVVYGDDMAAISVNSPVGVIMDGSYTVNATVQNMGLNPQTGVTVNCSIFEGGIGGDIINENFSTEPVDWTITHLNGTTAWTWDSVDERMEHSYGSTTPNEGYLDSPVLDCSGKSGITLSFYNYWKADYTSGDQDGYVRGSIDGGSTFPYLIDEFHHNDPPLDDEVKYYDISSWADGQAQVMVRYDAWNDNDWYWYIDDFIVNAAITGDLVYSSETTVSLAAYEQEFVEFSPAWDAIMGTFGIQVTTMLSGDENSANDVAAEVVSVEGPGLAFNPNSYNAGPIVVNDTDSTSFGIWNDGIGTLTYSLNETCGWVDVNPISGDSSVEQDTITVDINTTGLTPGPYQCDIDISSNGGSGVFSVEVIVVTSTYEFEDVNQSIQDRGFPIRHALDGDWAAAQNFTQTLGSLSSVDVYLRKFGTPEFNLTVELREDHPQGLLLDTKVFTPAEVPSNWEWFNVDFADQTVTPGTKYFVVIPPAPSGVTTSFGYEWGYAFGNQYEPGSFWFTRDGGALWRDLPTMYEFVFRTYGYA